MSKTVVITESITFSTGEAFEASHSMTLANAGDTVVVVEDASGVLTVRKQDSDVTFVVQHGQYK